MMEYKHYTTISPRHVRTIELDLSEFRHLEQLDLDISQLHMNCYRHAYFKIAFKDSTINNNEQDTAVYYRCKENKHQEILDLEPTTWRDMNKYGQVDSPHTLIFTLNVSSLNTLSIYDSQYILHGQNTVLRETVSLSKIDPTQEEE